MSANDKQVGGDHYKTEIQHWDYVLANNIPYLEAQVIKYLTRWRKKNGHQDLLKAKHFLDKLMEHEGVGEEVDFYDQASRRYISEMGKRPEPNSSLGVELAREAARHRGAGGVKPAEGG